MLISMLKFVTHNAKLSAAIIAIFGCAVFYWGPNVIHASYRGGVSETDKTELKAKYNNLTNQEERMKIYLWFHARGWNIDEGWHENFLQKKKRDWSELIQYWQI